MWRPFIRSGRVVALGAILILAACSDSDPDTATVGSSESGKSTGGDEGISPVDDGEAASPTTTAVSPEVAEAMDVAADFIEARDRRDLDATLALLSPDAAILDFGFRPRTPDEYAGLFMWMEILDWRWTLDQCSEAAAGAPIRVLCVHRTENEWSRAQGSEPVEGKLEFVVDDGLIVEVTADNRVWVEQVFRHWTMWLQQFHGDDLPTMIRLQTEDEPPGGPATTPEALDLYRIYVPEYVEWELASDG